MREEGLGGKEREGKRKRREEETETQGLRDRKRQIFSNSTEDNTGICSTGKRKMEGKYATFK